MELMKNLHFLDGEKKRLVLAALDSTGTARGIRDVLVSLV
jgi:hypothetical protein